MHPTRLCMLSLEGRDVEVSSLELTILPISTSYDCSLDNDNDNDKLYLSMYTVHISVKYNI